MMVLQWGVEVENRIRNLIVVDSDIDIPFMFNVSSIGCYLITSLS